MDAHFLVLTIKILELSYYVQAIFMQVEEWFGQMRILGTCHKNMLMRTLI